MRILRSLTQFSAYKTKLRAAFCISRTSENGKESNYARRAAFFNARRKTYFLVFPSYHTLADDDHEERPSLLVLLQNHDESRSLVDF
jgi:hypothetical protein